MFIFYIHNIVAGKAEGDIVHVLWVTCYTVQLQNFVRVDVRVLLYWCHLLLLFFGELRGLNLGSQIGEQQKWMEQSTTMKGVLLYYNGEIQTQGMRWITALHTLQPINLCIGCLGIQCLAIILLAAVPVGLRCGKYTTLASFSSDCVSGTEAVSNVVMSLSSNYSLAHWF